MTKSLPAHDLDAALDGYVSAISHALVDTVARIAPALDEPSTSYDPVHALWVLERYIDSVSGFAIGIVAASMARGARVWLGDGEDRAVVAALAALADRGIPEDTGAVTVGLWFERDTSLVDALVPWLHSRTCALAPEVRALANAVRDAMPAHRARALAVMFSQMRADTLVAERFAHELTIGWRQVLAVLAGESGTADSPLWQEWTRRICGDAPPPPPEPAPGEYIVVIR
jgi:hypothetical protein